MRYYIPEANRLDIEDVIAYLKCKPTVADRLRRLNPHPLYVSRTEASRIRGYHISRFNTDARYLIPLGRAVRVFGRYILDRIPREHIFKHGRRKFVSLAILEKHVATRREELIVRELGVQYIRR